LRFGVAASLDRRQTRAERHVRKCATPPLHSHYKNEGVTPFGGSLFDLFKTKNPQCRGGVFSYCV